MFGIGVRENRSEVRIHEKLTQVTKVNIRVQCFYNVTDGLNIVFKNLPIKNKCPNIIGS